MKFLRIIILVLAFTASTYSQQDPMFTQYMYNTQVVNPGYVGSNDMFSFGLLGRYQWVNVEGAPRTYTFTMGTPIGKQGNSGLGFSVVHDQVTIVADTNVNIDYSYSLNFSDDLKLAFGLKGGLDIFNVNYNELNTLIQMINYCSLI